MENRNAIAKPVEEAASASMDGKEQLAKSVGVLAFASMTDRRIAAETVEEAVFANMDDKEDIVKNAQAAASAFMGNEEPAAETVEAAAYATMAGREQAAKNAIILFVKLNHVHFRIINLRLFKLCRSTCNVVIQTTQKL
jgi:hypothetical protein